MVVDFIESKSIKKVVFLAGDVHASMGCTISKGQTKVHSIVSSPFFWPYSHPKKRTFQLSGPLKGNEQFEITNPLEQVNEDNYVLLSIIPNLFYASIRSRKGERIQSEVQFTF